MNLLMIVLLIIFIPVGILVLNILLTFFKTEESYQRGRIIHTEPNVVSCLWENWEIYDALLDRRFHVSREGPRRWKAHYGLVRGNLELLHCYKHKYRGYLLPRGGRVNNLHYGRALLVGDEGGLCDPLTGEGIYYGMKSAIIAADAIEECIRRNEPNLSSYTRRVNKEITSDLKYARLLSILLYQHPSDFVWILP